METERELGQRVEQISLEMKAKTVGKRGRVGRRALQQFIASYHASRSEPLLYLGEHIQDAPFRS